MASSEPAGEAVARDMIILPDVLMSDEQVARFRERLAAAKKEPFPPRFLTEDQVRQLLAECVTVVKPGETLVLRMGQEWAPSQLREVQEMLDEAIKWRELPFKAIVVPADELAVAMPEDGQAFAERVAEAIQYLNLQRRFPTRRGL